MTDPYQAVKEEVAQLYGEHAPGLLRYAGSFTQKDDARNDAVQECFLRYFIERRYGRLIANPRAWLYYVLRNYLLDRLKHAGQQREVAIDNLEDLPAVSYDPESLLQYAQTARQFELALTGRELDCVCLRVEGFSYREIAEAMAIRPGTVGALLSRASEKIHRTLPAVTNRR